LLSSYPSSLGRTELLLNPDMWRIQFVLAILYCILPSTSASIFDSILGAFRNFGIQSQRGARQTNPSSPSHDASLIVRTEKGFVEGFYQKSFSGRTFASFQSIPYGKSPSGNRRFRVS